MVRTSDDEGHGFGITRSKILVEGQPNSTGVRSIIHHGAGVHIILPYITKKVFGVKTRKILKPSAARDAHVHIRSDNF